MMFRFGMVIIIIVLIISTITGAEVPAQSAEDKLLALADRALMTGQHDVNVRVKQSIAHLYFSHERERQRLSSFVGAATTGIHNRAPLVVFAPAGRQWNDDSASAFSRIDVEQGTGQMVSRPTVLYLLQGARDRSTKTVQGPGGAFAPLLLAYADRRYSEVEAPLLSMSVVSGQAPLSAVTALVSNVQEDLADKVKTLPSVTLVRQAYDTMIALRTQRSSFAELGTLYQHGMLRLQLSGIPPNQVFNGGFDYLTGSSAIISQYVHGIYVGTASVASDMIDSSNLTTWMNTVFNNRYTVNRDGMPAAPVVDTYAGLKPEGNWYEKSDDPVEDDENRRRALRWIFRRELGLLGPVQSVDALIVAVTGLSASYSQAIAQSLIPTGELVDREFDAEMLEINAFDNYMQNTWAVDKSRRADGTIDLPKLNELRAIIRPAMQRARERMTKYFNERMRLTYNGGSQVVGHVNTGLWETITFRLEELSKDPATIVEERIGSELARALGRELSPAASLYVYESLMELRDDASSALAALRAGFTKEPQDAPAIDVAVIRDDAEQWLFHPEKWELNKARYAEFPYPGRGMTLKDHLITVLLSSLAAVDTLGQVKTTNQQPIEKRTTYQVLRAAPFELAKAIGAADDFSVIQQQQRQASTVNTTLDNQALLLWDQEFGPQGRVAELLADIVVRAETLRSEIDQERQQILSFPLPTMSGATVQLQRIRETAFPAMIGGAEGFLASYANLAGYDITLHVINDTVALAAQEAGHTLSLVNRRSLMRTSALVTTTTSVAIRSPFSQHVDMLRRAIAINIGRSLKQLAQASVRPLPAIPQEPHSVLPPDASYRPSGKALADLLGDAANIESASALLRWYADLHQRRLFDQWSAYRITALRMALTDLDVLAHAAYTISLMDAQREARNANPGNE